MTSMLSRIGGWARRDFLHAGFGSLAFGAAGSLVRSPAWAQLAAARTYFLATLEEIWQAAQSGGLSIDQRVRLRMACIHASQQARQVVETAYLGAGATAVFESNPFERRFRDMYAVSQQVQSHSSIFEAIGRHFLGLPLNARLI